MLHYPKQSKRPPSKRDIKEPMKKAAYAIYQKVWDEVNCLVHSTEITLTWRATIVAFLCKRPKAKGEVVTQTVELFTGTALPFVKTCAFILRATVAFNKLIWRFANGPFRFDTLCLIQMRVPEDNGNFLKRTIMMTGVLWSWSGTSWNPSIMKPALKAAWKISSMERW